MWHLPSLPLIALLCIVFVLSKIGAYKSIIFFLSIEKIKQFLKAMFPLYRIAFLADTKSSYPV